MDFQREVRPILSDTCFLCHGPDQSTRMVGLRLDTREGILEKRANGSPVVPGNPDASLIYQRINHKNAALRMPPAYSHKSLTDAQKETLRRWIEQGAPWKEHWAFAPPVRPEPPLVKAEGWVRNPIDRFVLARLEAAGLQPAPEADRRTLIRRVSLDLTGLPPAPAEVEGFVKDTSADAYEKLVDRLLASPHWGEHRGRYWLDAARYADTHGLHIDNYREMWPYRDWVIQAFNRSLPFDRFTIEQLAGDLLPDRTLDQQIASGFQRCNVTTNEAGVIIEEIEAIYAKDRVDTTGAVWLGLTVGCATCHDHKFDPISQKDFYSLAAFFRNTTQNVMDGNIHDSPPVMVVPREEDLEHWGELNRREAGLRERMRTARAGPGVDFEAWLNSEARRAIAAPLEASSQLLALSAGPDVNLTVKGKPKRLKLPPGVEFTDTPLPHRKGLRLGKDAAVKLPGLSYFEAGKPFSVAAWILFPSGEDNFVIASQADPKAKNRGWFIDVGARVPGFRLVGDAGEGIIIRAGHLEQLKPGAWTHLTFTYDGSREQTGLGLFINGKAVPTQGGGDDKLYLSGEIRNRAPLYLGKLGKRGFQDGAIADFRIFDRALPEEEAWLVSRWPQMEGVVQQDAAQFGPAEREAFHLYYLRAQDAAYRGLAAELAGIAQERRVIRRRGAVTHVQEERTDSSPMAHILYRGQYDQPREAAEPQVPAVLPPMPASFPRNRLGLAQLLVDAGNPLTARVTVNRFWQEVFGTGLVKTAEDFGAQGQPPSHPELLDWLAVEFRESGWDVKKFFRLLVTSATYRQSAATSPEKLSKDPENRLLSRGPRFRMDAEMVRDYALAASGLLARTIGGPSVRPYQPDGIWEAVAMPQSNTRSYARDRGERLYRRSLYTFWKRSAPPASMEIFNAPSRESCTVRRERTNTPLQALVIMNDPQFVEAARYLAQRAIEAAGGDLDRQIDLVTSHLLGRALDGKEREIVRSSYRDYLAYYRQKGKDSKHLLATGDSKPAKKIPKVELAALTMVTSQIMNLDEVLNK